MARLFGRRVVLRGAFAGAAAASVSAACSRDAKSADAAVRRFTDAVRGRDGRRLYATLDLPTRWSWMSIYKSQRETRELVMSTFPEELRDRELKRVSGGVEAANDVELFLQHLASHEGLWDELSRGLPEAPALEHLSAEAVRVPTTDGRTLTFRKGERGVWGFSGLAAAAEELKRKAIGDLEVVKMSAADYERAAARGAK